MSDSRHADGFVGPGFQPAAGLPPGVVHYTYKPPGMPPRQYERRLPHFDAIGARLFVTFRLHGSLPESRIFPPERLSSGRAFVAMDGLLDRARSGPFYLRRADVARIVEQALFDGQEKLDRYQLHAYAILPNHVHLLAESKVPAARWVGPLKGYTAHAANRLLGLKGPFWQDESYDHLVRNDDEFDRIRRYIENNPVSADLAHTPEEYSWSSAARRAEARRQAESLAPQGSATGETSTMRPSNDDREIDSRQP